MDCDPNADPSLRKGEPLAHRADGQQGHGRCGDQPVDQGPQEGSDADPLVAAAAYRSLATVGGRDHGGSGARQQAAGRFDRTLASEALSRPPATPES